MTPPLRIRAAQIADTDAIGRLHVECWKASYRGLLPDALIDGRDPRQRAAVWRGALAQGYGVYVVETDAEGLFGVGSCGAPFHPEIQADGEITALYLLPEAQRMGIGRSLLAWMAEDLADRGFSSVGLLVLTANAPARRFYEALGGRAAGEVQGTHDGYAVADTIYLWDDLDVLRIR